MIMKKGLRKGKNKHINHISNDNNSEDNRVWHNNEAEGFKK